MPGFARRLVERRPGALHPLGLGADVVLPVGGDRRVELVLLRVELRPQQLADQQPQPADAPLPLHLAGDLVEAVEDGANRVVRRRLRIGAGSKPAMADDETVISHDPHPGDMRFSMSRAHWHCRISRTRRSHRSGAAAT